MKEYPPRAITALLTARHAYRLADRNGGYSRGLFSLSRLIGSSSHTVSSGLAAYRSAAPLAATGPTLDRPPTKLFQISTFPFNWGQSYIP